VLPWREPYDWSFIAGFLAHRRIEGVECIDAGAWRRAVAVPAGDGFARGWIEVAPEVGGHGLVLTMSPELAPVADDVEGRTARLFDLAFDPAPALAVLGELAADAPGARLPGAFDGFEIGVRAIVGQQVSVRAARTLAARVAARHGRHLTGAPAGFPAIAFPRAADLAAVDPAQLAACGIVRARAGAIVELAQAVVRGAVALAPDAPLAATLAGLRAIRGIGEWTAQYVAMRALGWSDAFPAGDLVLMRALGVASPAAAQRAARAWQPWRARAVVHLWRRASTSPPT
jgi:AraC family transcriptional regulator of adaptative response / DNA-3-methyladenine glycosylase II